MKKKAVGLVKILLLLSVILIGCSNVQETNMSNNESSKVILTENSAYSAISVLGKDFAFPNRIEGMPNKLSDFEDLNIGSFLTSDGVRLSYWTAGTGEPLILLPGWSVNGAHFLNVMYLLSENYRVYTLDPRNQGLSEDVLFGNRISRYATDLKEFTDYLDIKSANYVGHSMGAAMLWSYIDLYGTKKINKVAFVDQPPVIVPLPNMTDEERMELGVPFDSSEQLENAMASIDLSKMDSSSTLYSENSTSLSNQIANNDMEYLIRVMYDHGTNDWRDVIQNKIDVTTAIFSGKLSPNLQSQQWLHSAIPNSTLYIYSEEEHGDHSLMEKNPVKFTSDLQEFLERNK
ncbi:Pimeloyl-ACP methyl ester carboxylesterase [Gracilibacillus ureilyticus]|uniref:Pimeloyl-ACP methyl ester carboxylesterase n=1 Tax=Gracilibacillus ureilyticus TaxID=531814 RepID=A0A1H9T9P0_9BACI|nr:alpha/beta hydrolase [Gracilibacillus ureilyticus]SER94010.1 Pimeloyl-ACP methyl ester carboxylesterase [Gracilibacillus ureilyticus]